MKIEPIDIDREAASLFRLTPGMRVWWPVDVEIDDMLYGVPSLARLWSDRLSDPSSETPVAIDTDDPATVGCMHVQVEEAEGLGMTVEVYRVGNGWFSTDCRGDGGPTRGAALVAAMRKFKEGQR